MLDIEIQLQSSEIECLMLENVDLKRSLGQNYNSVQEALTGKLNANCHLVKVWLFDYGRFTSFCDERGSLLFAFQETCHTWMAPTTMLIFKMFEGEGQSVIYELKGDLVP